MPSNALSMHLDQLLRDATELDTIHTQLRTGLPGRQYGLASLNRAAVVISVSAWESYVEELMRESLQALRPRPLPSAIGRRIERVHPWGTREVQHAQRPKRRKLDQSLPWTCQRADFLGMAELHLGTGRGSS